MSKSIKVFYKQTSLSVLKVLSYTNIQFKFNFNFNSVCDPERILFFLSFLVAEVGTHDIDISKQSDLE